MRTWRGRGACNLIEITGVDVRHRGAQGRFRVLCQPAILSAVFGRTPSFIPQHDPGRWLTVVERRSLLECRCDPLDDIVPVPGRALPEQTHRRIPRTVLPPHEPAHVGRLADHRPHGQAHRTGDVGRARAHRNHEIQLRHRGHEIVEVAEACAERTRRDIARKRLELHLRRPFCNDSKRTPRTRRIGRSWRRCSERLASRG